MIADQQTVHTRMDLLKERLDLRELHSVAKREAGQMAAQIQFSGLKVRDRRPEVVSQGLIEHLRRQPGEVGAKPREAPSASRQPPSWSE